ncbi:MAG TPA: DNA internalization-related competence protein ComEC/Rec2 [Nitrospira sp.]|nr:DNA internalization-related competence protein ComEC/Rec2 [Nitrospira sp.]
MLPSLTLAFIGGLALGSLVPYFPLSIALGLVGAVLGSAVLQVRGRSTAGMTTAHYGCLLAGILYWFVSVEASSGPAIVENEPETFETRSGRIISPVQLAPDRMSMVIRCDPTPASAGQPLAVRLTWRAPDRPLFEGDRIRLRARLRAPSGSSNPGGFDYAAYLERQGIDAVATVTGVEAIEFLESGGDSPHWVVWNQFDRWRASIRRSALESLSQPALGLYLGVIIGERGYLEPEVRDQFMVTGTVHLLSISGSHLGLVAMITFVAVRRGLLLLPASWLLALSRRITPTKVAAVATVVPVTAYACLAGAEVATVRSLLMVLVALMAKWLGYERRMFHALSAAALIIVAHDPQAIYDISFQLSFLSVSAVAWWLAKTQGAEDHNAPPRSKRALIGQWISDALLMSAVVTVVTIPLVALYFNQFPWLGLLTNLAAVPLMGGILVPMGLAAVLWQGVFGGGHLPLAEVIQWSMDALVSALRWCSVLPGAEWHGASPSLPSLVLFYGCLAALTIWSDRKSIRWIAGSGLLMLLVWWLWSPRLMLDGDRFRITFLDVSQGDSAVLELPDGEVVLIDGGASYERFDMGRSVVAPYLWNRGIRTIDYVIATHPQLDHVGGLTYVLGHFNVRHVWGSGDARQELFYQRLTAALAQEGLTEHLVRAGQDTATLGDCALKVLNPFSPAMQSPASSRRLEGHRLNNRSVVTQLTCGTHKMIFAGDVEHEALSRMSQDGQSERVDVVKVPHHGAGSSLQPKWLDRINPAYAVISVGRHNSYGHPADAVLQAYRARGISVFRTDRDGGVWLTGRRSQPALKIHRMKDERIQPLSFPACSWACELSNWERLLHRWMEAS